MFGYTLVDGLFEETFGGEHEVLPLACTVEKQRVEIQDAFENELIQREMNRVYDEQRRNPSNNPNDQLHFFNRRLNQQTNQNSNAVPLTQPSQENISIIREMGFADENLIKETLIRFNNDIVQSANFLLTNQNSQ
uniref:UBA domain-containing protein n=1 Tax=Rhabditophanes sp. KR3021 TaxID=114890 RepID=A0AC35UIE5_9BILA